MAKKVEWKRVEHELFVRCFEHPASTPSRGLYVWKHAGGNYNNSYGADYNTEAEAKKLLNYLVTHEAELRLKGEFPPDVAYYDPFFGQTEGRGHTDDE